jgi:hypothetical protein
MELLVGCEAWCLNETAQTTAQLTTDNYFVSPSFSMATFEPSFSLREMAV